MRLMERMLVNLDQSPWHAVYRIAIGLTLIPAWNVVFGNDPTLWALLMSFLGILLSLRVLPAVIRRVLPFSADVRKAWAVRRERGKRYDSYQWQKLFWIGVGLAAYACFANEQRPSIRFLTMFCLMVGFGGLAAWAHQTWSSERT